MLRAAEAANVFRIAAGALGITWEEVVLFRRLPFHQLNLSDHFGGRMSASYDALQQTVAKWDALGLDPAVIQRKVTNGYRAMWAAQGEAAIRTVVDTARQATGATVFGTILATVRA